MSEARPNDLQEELVAGGVEAAVPAVHDGETAIDGTVLDVLTVLPRGREASDDDGRPQFVLEGFWLDGLLPHDSPVIQRWRTDSTSRFPAQIWFDGRSWNGVAVISGVEWGRRPGMARVQATTVDRVTPV